MAWPTREEWTTLLREQETEYESSTDATLARYVKAILARFEPFRERYAFTAASPLIDKLERERDAARASHNFTLAELQTAQRDLHAARAALREVLEHVACRVPVADDIFDRWCRALGDAPQSA